MESELVEQIPIVLVRQLVRARFFAELTVGNVRISKGNVRIAAFLELSGLWLATCSQQFKSNINYLWRSHNQLLTGQPDHSSKRSKREAVASPQVSWLAAFDQPFTSDAWLDMASRNSPDHDGSCWVTLMVVNG